ncbi:MAG TPA: hypothetical protein VK988_11230 [Acidimicrobiales bacterium]|nr:hypothetical protein [Acidimicrobiales bacterium]
MADRASSLARLRDERRLFASAATRATEAVVAVAAPEPGVHVRNEDSSAEPITS